MQTICTLLQTDIHNNTSSLNFTGRMLFLTANQQCQSTEGKLTNKQTNKQTNTQTHTHTHTHTFNGPFSGTTWVSQYQKGKTNLDFTEARDSEWQWHQLGHMQVCISPGR